ncbi:MAG: class I SAM-dependent methyltransferase [Halobacteriovoraceae bacterium]|nr:class I SAM-dependent methyltransferase [Halobacteriovoraceae bacterium]
MGIILSIFMSFLVANASWARKPVPASRFEQLTGKKLRDDAKNLWDKTYSRSDFVYGKAPAKFLSENYHYIPFGSQVLDMGMGEGRNAVFLAKKGYKVVGADISSVAVKKAHVLAKEFGVKIKTTVVNLSDYDFPENSFDSIICFYYVDRSLLPKIKRWLKPGGVLIYEGNTLSQREEELDKNFPKSYYLESGELLKLFKKDYKILKFEEPEHLKPYRSSIIVKKEEKK